MQSDIVARLPQDAAKVLRYSHDAHMLAGEIEPCTCGAESTLVVRGETDSFGWEPRGFCQACYDALKTEPERFDEEARDSKPDQLEDVAMALIPLV